MDKIILTNKFGNDFPCEIDKVEDWLEQGAAFKNDKEEAKFNNLKKQKSK